MKTKICKKCNERLPITEFNKNTLSKDGYINSCKRCRSTIDIKELFCPVCNKLLKYWKFAIAKRAKTGRQWCCQKCARKLAYDSKNIRRKFDKEWKLHTNTLAKQSRKRNITTSMYNTAKRRAKIKNLEFSIEKSDIIIPKVCPILEHPFIFGDKYNYDWSPSLDRIDNTKGYIKNNIMVISKKANSMKNSATWSELQTFCKNILRYSPNNIK